MATVYNQILEFEKSNKFRFNQQGKKNVGAAIKLLYDNQYPFCHPIPTIESKEPEGTFLVLDYPSFFINQMDVLIADYVQRVINKKKKIIEKPTDPSPPKIASEPRKRNRIKTQTPAYSGKPLLNKK